MKEKRLNSQTFGNLGKTAQVSHCAFRQMNEKAPCGITTYAGCPGERCAFYATKEQVKAARESADARLRRLPHEYQSNISEKYYHRKMPWAEDFA